MTAPSKSADPDAALDARLAGLLDDVAAEPVPEALAEAARALNAAVEAQAHDGAAGAGGCDGA